MTPKHLKIWAKIQSLLVEVEGMKAGNAQNPDNPGYGEDQFTDMAKAINELADEIDVEVEA